jgi:hypothetical protein
MNSQTFTIYEGYETKHHSSLFSQPHRPPWRCGSQRLCAILLVGAALKQVRGRVPTIPPDSQLSRSKASFTMDTNGSRDQSSSLALENDASNLFVRRPVHIITAPAKDIGPIRRRILKFIQQVTRSQQQWLLHWAIYVDGCFFELRRIPNLRQPVAVVSKWPPERKKEILGVFKVGETTWDNVKIYSTGTWPLHPVIESDYCLSEVSPSLNGAKANQNCNRSYKASCRWPPVLLLP